MSRNVESHFGNIPTKNIRRSKFKRPSRHLTTGNTGSIIPIYRDEMLPGDTASIKESMVVRMLTPIAPVFDNAWIDTYYFFVPERLVWDHFKEFMGENTTDKWTQQITYTEPKTYAPSGGWAKGSIASYFGARINTDDVWIDSKWLRAYTLIYNEWFRNQNLSEPAAMSKGDSNTTGSNGTDYVNDLEKGGMPAKAVKYADAFTRCLPSPQKGPDVLLPLGDTTGKVVGIDSDPLSSSFPIDNNLKGKELGSVYAEDSGTGEAWSRLYDTENATAQGAFTSIGLGVEIDSATTATINQVRQAFAVQRLAEIDARSGTRYRETIAAHFGVTSPDARMQIPEYIGGKRVPINIADVVQQSSTDAVSPQGNVAGYSKTIDAHDVFTFSATEHGMIIGLAVIRTEHTYQQGIDRILTRENKLDYYWPALANLGEVYVKNRELYAQGTSADDEAFGYQESWYEYRYSTNRISGEFSSDYSTPLDIWHYGDDYSQLPTLGNDWVIETDANVARTLAIQKQDQFMMDFYFDQTWVRPMPIYSIPSMSGWM